MYWLIKHDPEVGMTTREFNFEHLAFIKMREEFEQHEDSSFIAVLDEDEAMVNTPIGTFQWKIVGTVYDPVTEAILTEIENTYGAEFLCSEEMAEFYVKHWERFHCASDIDNYAWLNTLFGYDIGVEVARQIANWLYNKMEVTPFDLPTNEDVICIMKTAKWYLDLDLDFSKFNTDPPAISYDW